VCKPTKSQPYTEGEEINYFLLCLLMLIKPFNGGLVQPLAKRLPGVGYVPPSKPWRWRLELEGETAPS
jgi:hypothetical protein